jgi:hypothetical protein
MLRVVTMSVIKHGVVVLSVVAPHSILIFFRHRLLIRPVHAKRVLTKAQPGAVFTTLHFLHNLLMGVIS